MGRHGFTYSIPGQTSLAAESWTWRFCIGGENRSLPVAKWSWPSRRLVAERKRHDFSQLFENKLQFFDGEGPGLTMAGLLRRIEARARPIPGLLI